MQILNFTFPAHTTPSRRGHIGVVASGDVEILVYPSVDNNEQASVRVRTSVDGYEAIWQKILSRFFAATGLGGNWEINDFAASPGVVSLRLQQAAFEVFGVNHD